MGQMVTLSFLFPFISVFGYSSIQLSKYSQILSLVSAAKISLLFQIQKIVVAS